MEEPDQDRAVDPVSPVAHPACGGRVAGRIQSPRQNGGRPDRGGLSVDGMALFYVLYSAELDRYYIGHTTEAMEERLRKHLSAHRGWTSRAKDWKPVHVEVFPEKWEAYAREREVKGWKNRTRIELLIRSAR